MISSRSSDYVHLRVLAFLPSGLKISPADLRQTSSGLALLPRFPSIGTAPLVCSFLSDWEKDGSRFDLVVTSLTTPWHQHQHHPPGQSTAPRKKPNESNLTSPQSTHHVAIRRRRHEIHGHRPLCQFQTRGSGVWRALQTPQLHVEKQQHQQHQQKWQQSIAGTRGWSAGDAQAKGRAVASSSKGIPDGAVDVTV